MRTPLILALALALILLTAGIAGASIVVVPNDESMIDNADVIVLATVHDMKSVAADNGDIVTEIEIDVERVLKGQVATGPLRIREFGGIMGTKAMFVSESPSYWTDNRALIFLESDGHGGWRTWGSSIGKFDFVTDAENRELLVRWAAQNDIPTTWTADGHPYEERLRRSSAFLLYITKYLTGIPPRSPQPPTDVTTMKAKPEADYFVDPVPGEKLPKPAGYTAAASTFPPSAYTQGNFRWDVFDKGSFVTFKASGTQPGYDGIGAAQRGLAAWTNEPGSNVDYRYGGTSTAAFVQDGQNTIVFNSSTDVPAGAVGYSKWYSNATHVYKGETFYSISEGDAVIRSGITLSQQVFEEAVTHELGHTLGFRHSDQGTPSSTQAVMKAVLSGNYGANLGPWDIEAVQTVYTGSGSPPPTAPTNLVATATPAQRVNLTWTSTGAPNYQVERSSNAGPFGLIATTTTSSYTDTTVAANTTYLYRVRASSGSSVSGYSNVDHATTVIFTDDPLLVRGTVIKTVHLTELRTAVNAMRTTAGLPAVAWTDPSPSRVMVKAVHMTELRNALTPAISAFGKTAGYTDTIAARGTVIKAIHFQEIRDQVK